MEETAGAPVSSPVSVAVAAQQLGVSERRVRQLIGEGRLRGTRASDGYLVEFATVVQERDRRRTRALAAVAPGQDTPVAAGDRWSGSGPASTPAGGVAATGPGRAGDAGGGSGRDVGEVMRLRAELAAEREARAVAVAELAVLADRLARLDADLRAVSSALEDWR